MVYDGIDGRKKSILASFHGRYHKIGKLLRDEPALGRVMASKKHICVDGLNVRKIVEDLEHLILHNVRKSIIPVYEIGESVERLNYLKRKTRI